MDNNIVSKKNLTALADGTWWQSDTYTEPDGTRKNGFMLNDDSIPSDLYEKLKAWFWTIRDFEGPDDVSDTDDVWISLWISNLPDGRSTVQINVGRGCEVDILVEDSIESEQWPEEMKDLFEILL